MTAKKRSLIFARIGFTPEGKKGIVGLTRIESGCRVRQPGTGTPSHPSGNAALIRAAIGLT
jgi:hypothetical protein